MKHIWGIWIAWLVMVSWSLASGPTWAAKERSSTSDEMQQQQRRQHHASGRGKAHPRAKRRHQSNARSQRANSTQRIHRLRLRPSWRRMWRRQHWARLRRLRRARRRRRHRWVRQPGHRRVARLFTTHSTRRALILRRRLLAQAKAQMKIKLPTKLPPRKDRNDPILTLQEAYELVKRNNLDLRILQQRVRQAELAKAKAWSILKPQLSLAASYIRSDSETSIAGTVIVPQNQLALQLKLQWAFINFSSIPLLQIAHLSVAQLGHTAKQVKREMLYATARAYYGMLLTDGMLQIAQQTWKNAKEHLRISMARLNAGVTPELLVTRAKLDVAKAWSSWIQAQNGLDNTRLGLALLLNKPHLRIRSQRPPKPILPAGNINDWRRLARRNREELKAARLAVKIAEKGITQQWMQYLPTVVAIGQVQGTNASGFTNRNYQWSVTIAAQMNLYSGGTRSLQVREAYSKLLQARLEQAKTLRKIDNEVSQASLALENAKVALQVAKKQLVLAQRSYQLTEDRYKTGVATPVEVSDAMTALQASKISVLREELNYELAIIALRRALGLFKP